MSKAVNSDGRVNLAVQQLAASDFATCSRKEVDTLLTNENLRQCTYEILLLAGYSYHRRYGEPSWPIQDHIEIKAWQSSRYREYRGATKGKPKQRRGPAVAVTLDDGFDAVAVLAAGASPATTPALTQPEAATATTETTPAEPETPAPAAATETTPETTPETTAATAVQTPEEEDAETRAALAELEAQS